MILKLQFHVLESLSFLNLIEAIQAAVYIREFREDEWLKIVEIFTNLLASLYPICEFELTWHVFYINIKISK